MNIDKSMREEGHVEKFVSMRLTLEQYNELKELARNNYMPLSTFSRKVLVKYLNDVKV